MRRADITPSPGRCILPLLLLVVVPFLAVIVSGCRRQLYELENVQISILAVGDTGDRRAIGDMESGQNLVARGMASEDRRRPVNIMLLLGDNFYEAGLRADKIVTRLKQNIVEPYCRFVELKGPDSDQVAKACRLAPEKRHPIPIFAVLGNHDHYTPGSAKLEREAIPRFVTNWRMPEGVAESFELGHGVSLVLFDSEVLAEGAHIETLRDAIRSASGPWRILVGHRPLRRDLPAEAYEGRHPDLYIESVERAVSEAGVPVQAFLSGHEHNLQILEMDPPAPSLHVIAGSGSRTRAIGDEDPRRRFGLEALGFVRLDLVGAGAENAARLVVRVFQVEGPLGLELAPPKLAAQWSVEADGHMHETTCPYRKFHP